MMAYKFSGPTTCTVVVYTPSLPNKSTRWDCTSNRTSAVLMSQTHTYTHAQKYTNSTNLSYRIYSFCTSSIPAMVHRQTLHTHTHTHTHTTHIHTHNTQTHARAHAHTYTHTRTNTHTHTHTHTHTNMGLFIPDVEILLWHVEVEQLVFNELHICRGTGEI